MPTATATWKSRLRSGSAHCDLQLAVEVRQCPLGSGARGGGPAVPTGIWTARRRRRVRRRKRRRWRRRRRRTALIKSNNPHLAGGEKNKHHFGYCNEIQLNFQVRNCCTISLAVKSHFLEAYLLVIYHFAIEKYHFKST